MRGLERNLELQELDSAIDRLDHRREALEAGEELSALRKEMEEADARLGEIRLAADAVASESRRLELEIESMNAKLEAEQKRMYDGSIANPKELEALQHEIASLRDRRGRAEDDLLEQMVRREDLDARGAEAEKDATAARSRVEEVGGDAVKELDRVGADQPHALGDVEVQALDLRLDRLQQLLRLVPRLLLRGAARG